MQASLYHLVKIILGDRPILDQVAELGGLVTGITVRKDNTLWLNCLLEKPCPTELLCEIEQSLERSLDVAEIILRQQYGRNLTAEQSSRYAATLRPWLIRHLWKTDASQASMLAHGDFQPDDHSVNIFLPDACCGLIVTDTMTFIDRIFHEHIAAKTIFTLCSSSDDLVEYTRKMNDKHRLEANQVMACTALANRSASSKTSVTQNKNSRTSRRQPKAEGLIWGKMHSELKPTPISSLSSESGLVLLEGKVFDFESRVVSNGTRVLVKFGLTDYRNSVGCILFLKPADREAVEENLIDAWIRINAEISFDSQFAKDLQARVLGLQKAAPPPPRQDTAVQKRIELHTHTKMSAKDSVADATELVKAAAAFGHLALAVTDHGVVQAFPDVAAAAADLTANGQPIKIIYGLEGYLVDDGPVVAWQVEKDSLTDGFIALDVETTGLDPTQDRLIEVAAHRFKPDGKGGFTPAESLSSLVHPGIAVPDQSRELTGISTEMLREAPEVFTFLEQLAVFIGDRPIVAHNALFDLGFLRCEGFRTRKPDDPRLKFNQPLIDTLALTQAMLPHLPNHRLDTVSRELSIDLEHHHRAGSDAIACGMIFSTLFSRSGAKNLVDLNRQLGHQSREEILDHKRTVNHVILLARSDVGLYHLYRLVSASHMQYFHTRPRIPKSLLRYFRTGLLVGGACEAGEIFQAVLKTYQQAGNDFAKAANLLRAPELVNLVRFYDYLEIQPVANNAFYLRDPSSGLTSVEDLMNLNRLVVKLANQNKKPVCATCDVHFIQPHDAQFRRILMADMGYADAEHQAELFLRTTDEMLEEFAYLGEKSAHEVVISHPADVADQIQGGLKPFPDGSFPPIIDSAADEIRQLTWNTAHAIYGFEGGLPDLLKQRIDRELSAIIDNGFAIMYYIAYKLVKKSNDDGYIVGSRGSVGSSLVATLCGISEVNPLPPHYICPNCHHSIFDTSGAYGSGYDLPAQACPMCGTPFLREGQDIPFATFLGFDGDKQPDIDLNFSGEYQAKAHRFIEEMFGSTHTFRAGTISGYAEKNALAMVVGYFREKEQFVTQAEISRLSQGLIGVKRTTGQHPGGIVVVPKEREIYDFTPIQHPADRSSAGTVTTHFDFNAMHDTILKLDVLGHDDPTMLKMLGDLTGVDVRSIPIPDEKVMSLFRSTEALGIPDGHAPTGAATLGLPELGTFMAREMIRETRPARFYDLVQLMGLSHGTDVWKGNAQQLILSGTCTINEVIGCRDSIMTWLIYKGLPPKTAFDIMERVRRGRGVSAEQEQLMREKNVPEWYIDSCNKIRYMFPKAHAVAYTISSLRIAWFKVYHPEAYYCVYFTVRANEFDSKRMCLPPAVVRQNREQLRSQFRDLPDREQKIYYILELVEEMQLRGIDFVPIDLYDSAATTFVKVAPGRIRPPLNAIPFISSTMAESIVRARVQGPFKSRDDLMRRAGIGQSAVENLAEAGCLGDLPATSQIEMSELFD
jgi:DNA polymerase-3 subunit alpha (Gram-positive type)